MSANVRRFLGLWHCLDSVEQQALYELVQHRVSCSDIDGKDGQP